MLSKAITYQNPSRKPAPGAIMGDQHEIVLEYSSLVKTMALRLQSRLPDQVCSDDLFTAGIIGLMDAINKFDPTKGIPFPVYAKTRIRGAMLDEIRSMDWVPRAVRQKTKTLESACRDLEQHLGRYPEDEEIAARLNLTMEEYHDLLNEVRSISFLPDQALDVVVENGESDLPGAGYDTPYQQTYRKEIQKLLAQIITTLSEREQQVLALYYQDELTMKEIGAVLGCSESRICQIHSKVILKLRTRLAASVDQDDLPARYQVRDNPGNGNGKAQGRNARGRKVRHQRKVRR